jgi:multimeric flavodoxin WrbA
MKIIALLGSPRGLKGNTGRLLQHVLAGASKNGAQSETIVLKGDTVLPCLGCDVCHRKGACAQNDAFKSIKQKIEAADGLVLASPNYISWVSAQLKAFMDRCCGVLHTMGFEGKYGASVVTSGGGDEEPIAEYMNHFLAITGVVPVGSVWATMASISGDGFPDEIKNKARDLGKNLALAIQNKTSIPKNVMEEMNAFRERMEGLLLWRKDEWPFEYEYLMKKQGAKTGSKGK